MKRIGSITPIWNQELFIKPHFDMLSKLDRNVVLMQPGPLPQYHKEHGYSKKPDLSRYLLETYFPKVEIYDGNYPTTLDFGAGLYNEGLLMMQDCDVVLRLDPDMLFTEKDWDNLLAFIQNNKADGYQMDFRQDSINYYITGDYNHGLKDAQEDDCLAVGPKYLFSGVLDFTGPDRCVIRIPDWICHHFRGWNKPKSTPSNWDQLVSKDYIEQYWDKKNQDWYHCPPEIRAKMESWMMELKDLKETI